MSTVAFIVIALILLVSSFMVVYARNLVHGVFWLSLALVGTAALYIILHASFLAAIQILLYAGGIITLMLFGIMLTARHDGVMVPNPGERRGPGALAALVTAALLLAGIWRSDTGLLSLTDAGTTAEVGAIFLGSQLLAFEVLSVLLLAGMIGAIVLTRNQDPR